MASKVPIEVKMISWFARAPEAEAQRQFATVRALMLDRGFLRRGAKAAKSARQTRPRDASREII